MLKKSVADSIIRFWPVSDRRIMKKLSGKHHLKLSLIQVYAPTSNHNDKENEEVYESTSKVMRYSKSVEIAIITCHLNAKKQGTMMDIQ